MPFFDIYLKECKSTYRRDNCTLIIIVALFTIAKLWSQRRCPGIDAWIKKCGIYPPWSIS
jgi:hypothetical protein